MNPTARRTLAAIATFVVLWACVYTAQVVAAATGGP